MDIKTITVVLGICVTIWLILFIIKSFWRTNEIRWLYTWIYPSIISVILGLGCFILIDRFVDASIGDFTWHIEASDWAAFGSFTGALLLAITLIYQIRTSRRQQVESKFFELVKYYRDNVSEMKLRNPFHHKSHEEKYAEGRRVIKVIFDQYKVARGIVNYQKVVNVNDIDSCLLNPKDYNHFFSRQSDEILSNEECKLFIENEMAYLITFWGVSSGTVKEMESWLTEQFKLEDKMQIEKDYPELKTELVRQILKCIALYKCDENNSCNENHSDMLYSHLKQTANRKFVGCVKATKKTKFFGGHQYQLGHYFRHLYQTVKYIDNQSPLLFSKDEKYEYIKTLRAQMSNYEQAMLFINSLTKLGRNWEYDNDEKNLISDYNLIKNLPENFIPDMKPQFYYPDVDFEWAKKNI